MLQRQAVQKELDLIELRLVTAKPLEASQEERLRALVLAGMPQGMRLELRYCETIARGAGGKFEDFICEVKSEPR